MEMSEIVGLGLTGAVLSVVLGGYKKEYALLSTLCTGFALLLLVLAEIEPVLSTMTAILDRANMTGGYTEIIFKSIGICFITQIATDVCKDSGNSAIATKVELAGRVAILVIALPLFTTLLELVGGLITL